MPFDIPDNWAFIRLENALIYEQPTEYIVDSTDYNNAYPIPVLTAEKQLIDTKFAYYIMQTIEHDHDTHKRYWISEYGKKVIGLPPLKEQLKIVETIEDLFGLLD